MAHSDIKAVRYEAIFQPVWDEYVRKARQSSFLFERSFMDYHADRFTDASLIVRNAKNKILALLPACESRKEEKCIESHGGLTYGGLLLMPETTTPEVEAALAACISYYKEQGYSSLIYKPLPYIYHAYPAQDDLYALTRQGARLYTRSVSSVIDLRCPYKFSTLRQRKVRKALSQTSLQMTGGIDNLPAYWNLLDQVLQEHHNAHPVHTLSELHLLMKAFPQQIELCVVTLGSSAVQQSNQDAVAEQVVAGCILFHTSQVVHVQYIAANDQGRQIGALDWLFAQLIERSRSHSSDTPYFDFGTSTEQGGKILNEGLIFQKEGFGARAVCYDAYRLDF